MAGGSVHCPNCGAPASKFCPECGQRQGARVPTIREWIGENADELLINEARLPRTLRALVWPPGTLTAEWLAGRRARWVSPLRLYLLAAIPFFLLLGTRAEPSNVLYGAVEILQVMSPRTPGYLRYPDPLPVGERDSTSLAAWRAEVEGIRERNEAIDATRDELTTGTYDRVVDSLPLIVGVLLVPVFGVFSWLSTVGSGAAHRLAAHLVFSLHVHAFTYLLIAGALILGTYTVVTPPAPAVAVALAGYLVLGFRRGLGAVAPRAVAATVVCGVFYLVAFTFTYLLTARWLTG